jgi:hypothetical protein
MLRKSPLSNFQYYLDRISHCWESVRASSGSLFNHLFDVVIMILYANYNGIKSHEVRENDLIGLHSPLSYL